MNAGKSRILLSTAAALLLAACHAGGGMRTAAIEPRGSETPPQVAPETPPTVAPDPPPTVAPDPPPTVAPDPPPTVAPDPPPTVAPDPPPTVTPDPPPTVTPDPPPTVTPDPPPTVTPEAPFEPTGPAAIRAFADPDPPPSQEKLQMLATRLADYYNGALPITTPSSQGGPRLGHPRWLDRNAFSLGSLFSDYFFNGDEIAFFDFDQVRIQDGMIVNRIRLYVESDASRRTQPESAWTGVELFLGSDPANPDPTVEDRIVFYYHSPEFENSGSSKDDFLVFGYWVDTGADSMGYDFDTFHYGRTPDGGDRGVGTSSIQEVDSRQGTADYVGPATGQFTRFDPTAPDTATGGGQFTARASLRASFGPASGEGAPDSPFTLSGDISDFRDASGQPIQTSGGEDWSVTLEATEMRADRNGIRQGDFGPGANFGTVPEGERNARTFDGQPAADKGWFNGDFHDNVISRGEAVAHPSRPPRGLLGRFNANFENGHAAGAFGGLRQDDP